MNEKTPILGRIMKIIACTPNKNFNEEDYQKRVIDPTRQLRKLYEEVGEKELDEEQINWALSMLKEILIAKQVEDKERTERIEELMQEYNLSNIPA